MEEIEIVGTTAASDISVAGFAWSVAPVGSQRFEMPAFVVGVTSDRMGNVTDASSNSAAGSSVQQRSRLFITVRIWAGIVGPKHVPIGLVPEDWRRLRKVLLVVDHVTAPFGRLRFLRCHHPSISNGQGAVDRSRLVDEMDSQGDQSIVPA